MPRALTVVLLLLLAGAAVYGAWHFVLRSESGDDEGGHIEDAGADPETSDRAAVRFLSATADLDLTTDQERVVIPALRKSWKEARAAIAQAEASSASPEDRNTAIQNAINLHMSRLVIACRGVLSPEQTARICNAYLHRLPSAPDGTSGASAATRDEDK